MKSGIALAIGLALALPAFAQDQTAPQPSPAPTTPSDQQATPSDQQAATDTSSQTTTDTSQPPPRHARHSRKFSNGSQNYNPAATALSGNEPGTAAYQASNREKAYPAVDHGHVPGDPPIIDHSGDHATVPDPTHATISVPPDH
jgi:hypothetical protein